MNSEELNTQEITEMAIFHSDYFKNNGKYHKDINILLNKLENVISKASSKYNKNFSSKQEKQSENYMTFLKCIESYDKNKNDNFVAYLYKRIKNSSNYFGLEVNKPTFFKFSSRFQRKFGNHFRRLMESDPNVKIDELVKDFASKNSVSERTIREFIEYTAQKHVQPLETMGDLKKVDILNKTLFYSTGSEMNQENILDRKQTILTALDIISKMPLRHQEIARTIYDEDINCAELADKYGVSKQMISQNRQAIIEKLSKIKHMK
jgi:RNA polymerase sigma factor (sigma-70 family)